MDDHHDQQLESDYVPPIRSPAFWRSSNAWSVIIGFGFALFCLGSLLVFTPIIFLGLCMLLLALFMIRVIEGPDSLRKGRFPSGD